MRLLIDDEFLELTQADMAWLYLDSGNESSVYKYGDEVLKIYSKNCGKLRLDQETARKLSSIHTYRLLLPKRIIRDADSGEFLGYTTSFIKRASTTGIIRMKMFDFLCELDLLREDIKTLNSNSVEVEDFNLNNTAYDGKIYLVDPGSYVIRRTPETIRFLRGNNAKILNDYVKNDIFGMAKLSVVKQRSFANLFDEYDYIGDMIRETAKDDESVRQYVKRMAR